MSNNTEAKTRKDNSKHIFLPTCTRNEQASWDLLADSHGARDSPLPNMPAVSLKPQTVVSASGPEKQKVTKPGAWRKLSSCTYVTVLATIYVIGSQTKNSSFTSPTPPHPTCFHRGPYFQTRLHPEIFTELAPFQSLWTSLNSTSITSSLLYGSESPIFVLMFLL